MSGYRSNFFPSSSRYHLCDVGKLSNIPNSLFPHLDSTKVPNLKKINFLNSKFKFLKHN